MTPETDARATPELTLILEAMAGLKRGDFGARLPRDWTGITGKIADDFNEGTTFFDKGGQLRIPVVSELVAAASFLCALYSLKK